MIEWLGATYLELRVLDPAETDAASPFDLGGRDEPPPAILNQDEEEVEPSGIELLDNPVPALIAARGSELQAK